MSTYPDSKWLEQIEAWDYKDLGACFDFIESIWAYPDYVSRHDGKFIVSTGGWSGNEDIIGSMRSNHMLWAMTWEQSRRGGHYIFDLGRHV